MDRVYNFSAGPSMLFEDVLLSAQKDFLNYNGSGMSVTEMSHRAKCYEAIHDEAISLLRELMGIPEDYYVLFLQGGASMQFEAIPLNLLKKGRADYIVTGNFAKKAYKEAVKYGDIVCAASSEDKNFTYIPKNVKFRDDLDYVYYTANNTIFGTRFTALPEASAPLVSDMSSNILSETVDVSKFGLIYAGAQKNIAPAGVTIVIVKKDLVDNGTPLPFCPTMLKYSTQAKENSLYNTPPTFAIYMAMLTFRHLKNMGGVSEIQKINEYKAGLLYDYIDNSSLFFNYNNKEDRSIMNVTFVTKSEELNAKFVKEAAANGLVTLKGHKLVGGMRASIYNAMPVEGVKKLVSFMKKFEAENK